LTPQAVLRLFDAAKLAAEGCSILISHKLDEIRAICHRATVLRRASHRNVRSATETNATLARMMIGGELPPASPRWPQAHPR
jgi:simple sugar transport system ATP-binding protein